MQETRYDVVGIGNAIVDIFGRCEDGFLTKHDLAKGFMRLIDAPEADRLYGLMGPAMERSGGSAANTIAGLTSFGGKGAFIGRVADDQFGKVFWHDIRASGVAFETAPATGGLPTAVCLILVTPDGERTMNTFLGASTELGPNEVDAAMIAAAKVTYLEGYLFDKPEAKEAFHAAAAIAAKAGRKTALSLSDAFCVDRHRTDFRKLVKSEVDILFANEKGDHRPLRGELLRRGRGGSARRMRDRRADALRIRLAHRHRQGNGAGTSGACRQGRRRYRRRRSLCGGISLRLYAQSESR